MALIRAFFCAVILALFAINTPAVAQPAVGDMALGDSGAPVTVIEYASMTCPHCATFHQENYKKMISEFVDTGQVYFIFREFPLDNLALVASVLARCAGKDRFFPFLETLFKQQESWASSEDPFQALSIIGQSGGLSPEQFEACTRDDDLVNSIANSRLQAEQQFNITSTPTFIVNGVAVAGNLPWEEFANILKQAAAGEDIADNQSELETKVVSGAGGTYLAIAIVLGLLAVAAFFFLRQPGKSGN
jgi:protein-disulfide isomerase